MHIYPFKLELHLKMLTVQSLKINLNWWSKSGKALHFQLSQLQSREREGRDGKLNIVALIFVKNHCRYFSLLHSVFTTYLFSLSPWRCC